MTRILVVDDSEINLMIIEEMLKPMGFDLAEDGEVAWALIEKNHYDLLVIDRIMPRLDGLSLLKRVKADARWRATPVIMQTAASSKEAVAEGIEAGAYYYLTKPYEPKALQKLVETVVSELNERLRFKEDSLEVEHTLANFKRGELHFRTLAEARSIVSVVSRLCAENNTIAMGLLELLTNAVEHGNLGITYREKSELRSQGNWESEIERRLGLEPWCSRTAKLIFERRDTLIEFKIIDEGAGFEWQKYLSFDPDRAFDLHGRGIAMAGMVSFVSIEYQGNGNTVVAIAKA
jgi:DNA-binding response OmpR family regulator